MRILIVGAGGQLGSYLSTHLSGHQVTALSHGDLDIIDRRACVDRIGAINPNLVINAAAFANVDTAEVEVDRARAVNEDGPANLAVATRQAGAALLHVSTDYVFDGCTSLAYDELSSPNPINVYGATKLAGEDAVRALNPQHFIVRTAWLYQAGGRSFPNTLLQRAHDYSRVEVVADQFGSPTYIPHFAFAVSELITTRDFGTIHLAGAGVASWLEFAEYLFKVAGREVELEGKTADSLRRRARRPAYSALRSRSNRRLPPWQRGVEQFIEAHRILPA